MLAEIDGFDFRGEQAFRAFLFHRAVRKILKRRRFHRQERRDPAREVSLENENADDLAEYYATIVTPSRHAGAREQLRRVDSAMSRLPEAQRDAVAMSRVLGMSYAEIAAQLDKTESAVRGLVARGLAAIARLCQEEGA